MNDSKENKKKIPDIAYLIISALLAWAGCYLFTMRLGIITTVPFVIMTAATAAMLKLNVIRTAAFYAVFGFLLPLIDSQGLMRSVFLASLCIFFCLAVYAAVSLFKSKKNNGAILKICAVLLSIISIVIHVHFNSDPVSFKKNEKIISDYIKQNYKYEKMSVSSVSYSFNDKDYSAVAYYTKKPTEKAVISVKDGVISDGYISLTERFLLEKSVLSLTETLRSSFPSGNFSVSANGIVGYPRGEKASAESDTDYSPYSVFNIYFTSSMTASDFAYNAEQYFNALQKRGFNCYKLIFYAGSGGKYYSKIETRFISMKARFDGKIVKNV